MMRWVQKSEDLGDISAFQRSLHGIEVISFDELLNRARFITRSEAD